MGHSPKLGFSLHKALDKVLRKVGAREKSQTPHPPEGSTGTAPLSGHTSRRSSIGSMGLPEAVNAGEVPSSSRHAIMPGWQVRLSDSSAANAWCWRTICTPHEWQAVCIFAQLSHFSQCPVASASAAGLPALFLIAGVDLLVMPHRLHTVSIK